MKRWTLRIFVFLLLGAIVNVAVAWGCGWKAVPVEDSLSFGNRTVDPSRAMREKWPVPEAMQALPLNVWACRTSAWGIERFQVMSGVGVLSNNLAVPLEQMWPWWVSIEPSDAITAASPRGPGMDLKFLAQGWPVFSLCCESRDGADLHPSVMLNTEPGKGSMGYYLGIEHVLALRPIWPGFAINTVFYAVVLWLLFAGPFVVRRWRRIRRGLCPKCAYDLRGRSQGSACPECGSIVAS